MDKYEALLKEISSYGKVAIAFSSGVDSTFLLYAAKEALGDNVIAITAAAPMFPRRELMETKDFCSKHKIRQIVLQDNTLEDSEFVKNSTNRCYLCKYRLFSRMKEIAAREGFDQLREGTNVDDLDDYRPGMQAISELDISSPLQASGWTKEEIRNVSQKLGLYTWNKPSFACLASRFVYGEEITSAKLQMINEAEEYLLSLGFQQVRVRLHGTMARIEVPETEIENMTEPLIRSAVVNQLLQLGFSYVTLDLKGYQTGSMNLFLEKK